MTEALPERDPRLAESRVRRGPLVLVGLSGAGKTAAGRLLAARLGAAFVDLDAEVERLAGQSVAEVFTTGGEPLFRALERRATLEMEVGPRTVVSTGGGWMSRADLRDTWPGAIRVWLAVDPAEAGARLARDSAIRPLLAGPHPEATLERLLAERLPAYRLAEVRVRTDALDPSAVVDSICNELAARGLLPAAR